MPTGLGGEKLWLCPSLDDSASDISGNGNNGTYQGGMGTIADTNSGGSRAYDFDGVDDRIEVASPNFTSLSTDYSMSCWVKIPVDNQIDPFVMLADLSGNYRMMYLASFSNSLTYFGHNEAAGFNHVNTSTSLGGQGWMHISGTYDNTSEVANLYINGSLVATGSVPRPLNTGGGDFYVGARDYATTSDYMTGQMDDVRVYERVLATDEITHLATSRGVLGSPASPVGLGDELLWMLPSHTGDASNYALDSLSGSSSGVGTVTSNVTVSPDPVDSLDSLLFNNTSTQSYKATWNSGGYSTYTVSYWYRSTDPGRTSILFNYQGSTGGVSYLLHYHASSDALWQWNDGTSGAPTGYLDRDGTWHHVAVQRQGFGSGGVSKYYYDGVLVWDTVPNGTDNGFWTSNWMEIGVANPGTGRQAFNWLGSLDDFRVYDRLLTDEEITHLASERGASGVPTDGRYNPFVNIHFITRRLG